MLVVLELFIKNIGRACSSLIVCVSAGLSACSHCPTSTPIGTGPTSCGACPDGLFCPLGASTALDLVGQYGPVAGWQQAITTPNPLDALASNVASNFASLSTGILSALVVVVLSFVALGVTIQWQGVNEHVRFRLGTIVFRDWSDFDFLYRSNHFTPNKQYPLSYRSCLGTVLTILTALVVALAGSLIIYQLFLVIVPVSVTVLNRAPFEPRGFYALTIRASGLNMAAVCQLPPSLLLAPTDASAWTGAATITSVYTALDNTCAWTWQCPDCHITPGVPLSGFTLQTTVASWVNFYAVNFTAPSLVTASGSPFQATDAPFSVSQLIFPSSQPSWVERRAFRASVATQAVSLLLTSLTASDQRASASTPTVYAAYLPSLVSVSKAVPLVAGAAGTGAGAGGISAATSTLSIAPTTSSAAAAMASAGMVGVVNDTSPVDVQTGAGFALTVTLNRNSMSVLTYVRVCLVAVVCVSTLSMFCWFLSMCLCVFAGRCRPIHP